MAKRHNKGTYLQHEDLAGGPIDIELAVGRIVRIDTLAGEEVDDVLGPILITVRGRDLHGCIAVQCGCCRCGAVRAKGKNKKMECQ